MAVTQPMVILKRLENGDLIEPVEEVKGKEEEGREWEDEGMEISGRGIF